MDQSRVKLYLNLNSGVLLAFRVEKKPTVKIWVSGGNRSKSWKMSWNSKTTYIWCCSIGFGLDNKPVEVDTFAFSLLANWWAWFSLCLLSSRSVLILGTSCSKQATVIATVWCPDGLVIFLECSVKVKQTNCNLMNFSASCAQSDWIPFLACCDSTIQRAISTASLAH